MFSYIRGLLVEVLGDTVVVESGGIGWNLHVPLSVLEKLPHIGEEVKVYTSFQVREDAMTLYGFFSRQDLQMFQLLLGVSGIGPKAALGILSSMTPDDLRIAILSEDVKAISKAPGIGPKTAKRMILDLKDRISMEDILSSGSIQEAAEVTSGVSAGGAAKEAIEALAALGYSMSEAAKAVHQVELTDDMSVEAVLKAALRYLAF